MPAASQHWLASIEHGASQREGAGGSGVSEPRNDVIRRAKDAFNIDARAYTNSLPHPTDFWI